MKKKPFKLSSLYQSVGTALAVSVLLAGCGGVPANHPTLQKLHAAYQQAQQNTNIVSLAPVALHEADQAIKAAQRADGEEQLEHLAYIAERKIQIAVATADRKASEQEIERLAKEKDKIVIQSREKETVQAQEKAASAEAEAAAAAAKAKKLEEELAALQAKQTERGMVVTLGDVLFESGKAELMGGSLRNIDQVADFLIKNPKRNVLVEGHTDSVGSNASNQALSENRANAVRLALIQRSVESRRIIARGYGESMPIANNDTPTGRQQNRRVEIIILNEGDTANFR